MEKRKNIVDKFSSFISFTENNYPNQIQLSWKVDFELENNMKSKVQADPAAKESFWVQYFLKVLLIQSSSDRQSLDKLNPECNDLAAKRHLSAYLQEACFKAAKDIHHEFRYIKHKYSFEEYFQIANVAASSPGKCFKSFNFERDTINVEAYAITAFKRFIRNQIYQQDLEARRTKFSDYGLLKYISLKELNEALLAQNLSQQQVILHRLAWQCFNEIFQPISHSLSQTRNPSPSDFAAIASYYNQRCNQLALEVISATDVTIKEILSNCISMIKKYRTKRYFSFEENFYNISDPANSALDELIQQEEWQQVEIIVDKTFTNMPQLCQIIFKLWQGLNLTQAEIANLLKYKYPDLQKQYQVARLIKRYTRSMLKEFACEWNKVNSEIYLDCDRGIEKIKLALDQCLILYCEQKLFSMLDIIILEFSESEQKNIFSNINSINQFTEKQTISALNWKIVQLFQCELEKSMCFEINSLSVVNHKIVDLVNQWIRVKKGSLR
jgi:hypothetical protein